MARLGIVTELTLIHATYRLQLKQLLSGLIRVIFRLPELALLAFCVLLAAVLLPVPCACDWYIASASASAWSSSSSSSQRCWLPSSSNQESPFAPFIVSWLFTPFMGYPSLIPISTLNVVPLGTTEPMPSGTALEPTSSLSSCTCKWVALEVHNAVLSQQARPEMSYAPAEWVPVRCENVC